MKKYILLLIAFIAFTYQVFSQTDCLSPKFEDKCSGVITSIIDDYVYLKSRAFSSQVSTDVLFSVSLKRNIKYVFSVCELFGNNNMVINLYDENDKIVASNIDPKTKKIITAMTFKPTAAGKYYVLATFEKKESNCCLILFGLMKDSLKDAVK